MSPSVNVEENVVNHRAKIVASIASLNNVTKNYGPVAALREVRMEVQPGELLASSVPTEPARLQRSD